MSQMDPRVPEPVPGRPPTETIRKGHAGSKARGLPRSVSDGQAMKENTRAELPVKFHDNKYFIWPSVDVGIDITCRDDHRWLADGLM